MFNYTKKNKKYGVIHDKGENWCDMMRIVPPTSNRRPATGLANKYIGIFPCVSQNKLNVYQKIYLLVKPLLFTRS